MYCSPGCVHNVTQVSGTYMHHGPSLVPRPYKGQVHTACTYALDLHGNPQKNVGYCIIYVIMETQCMASSVYQALPSRIGPRNEATWVQTSYIDDMHAPAVADLGFCKGDSKF